MNYISKIILKQFLPQFIQIPQDSVLVDPAGITLSQGAVKTNRINPTLKNLGLRIHHCSYLNILLDVPWLEIHKKPIRVIVQQITGDIYVKETDDCSSEDSFEDQLEEPQKAGGSSEYLKSFLKGLLFRMEVVVKSVNFTIRNKDQETDLTLKLQNLTIKNSNLSSESKDIMKTVLVERMDVCLNEKPILTVKDFNLCLDVGEGHLKIICLVNRVFAAVDLKELKRIQNSLEYITRKPRSRNGSQTIIDPDNRKINEDQRSNITDVFFKLFELETVLCVGQGERVTLQVKNTQYVRKAKTKISVTSLHLLHQSESVLSISSSKALHNSKYFINYHHIEEKSITDPEIQITTLSPQHSSIRVLYLQIHVTQQLLILLKLYLPELIQGVRDLIPSASEPPQSSDQLAPTLAQSITTTVIIYQCLFHVSFTAQYKLYVSVQCVVDRGCLYELDCMQMEMRGSEVEVFKVYDVEVSVTEDDIYVGLEIVQVHLWMGVMRFFKELSKEIKEVTESLSLLFKGEGRKEESEEVDKKEEKAEVVEVRPKYKYLFHIRNIKTTFGSILPKGDSFRFIDLLEISVKDSKVIVSNCGDIQGSLSVSLVFTDQHTLLQQSVSNSISISYEHSSSKDSSLEIRNNVSLKLESRYIRYLMSFLQDTNRYITVTSFVRRRLKIISEGSAPLHLQPRIHTHWFPLTSSFRLESIHSKATTDLIKLNFEMDVDHVVFFGNSKEHLILRLVKSAVSSTHLLVKPSFKMINCVKELVVVNERQKLEMKVQSHPYDSSDFEDQYSLLKKSEDLSDFEGHIEGHGETLLFIYPNNQICTLTQLVSKDNINLFAFKNKLTGNYNNYALQKSRILIVMPFLTIRNSTHSPLRVLILEKRTSKTVEVLVEPEAQLTPQNNDFFDFYMRQLTVKVALGDHNSEEYYFNTFAFLSEPHEQLIPLRSSQKGHFDKKHLIIRETSKLRTKFLEFITPLTVMNQCQFSMTLRVDQRGVMSDTVLGRSPVPLSIALRSEYGLQVYYEDQLETKVTLETTKLKDSSFVLSFNFCKVGDKFKNILVLVELQRKGEQDNLVISPFITLKNLSSIPVSLEDIQLLPNQEHHVAISCNSNSNFNNRSIRMDSTSCSEMFDTLLSLETNKRDLVVSVGEESILLTKFLGETVFEVTKVSNKSILRIVKDTHTRINLYIIEGIHPHEKEQRYSIIKNDTPHHFLISEQPLFSRLFDHPNPNPLPNHNPHPKLSKTLVEPYTTSTLTCNNNYNILLCNQGGEKLNELTKSTLSSNLIHEEKNSFSNVETRLFSMKTKASKGKQLRTKNVEMELSLDGENFVTLLMKDVKVRKLEESKFDLLIKELVVRDLKKNANVVTIKDNAYALVDVSNLNDSLFLISNIFLKLTSVELDLRKDFLMKVIRFSKNLHREKPLSEPSDINRGNDRDRDKEKEKEKDRDKDKDKEKDKDKDREKDRDKDKDKETRVRENALMGIVKSKLCLIKNVFIQEFTIQLNLELDALVFENTLSMPLYKISSMALRSNKFFSELWKFYSSSLVSKFPKLTFLLQNLRHPLNILKNICNLRETLKSKPVERLEYWSAANKYSPSILTNQLPQNEVMACVFNSVDRIVMLTNKSLFLQQYSPIPCRASRWKLSEVRRVQSTEECLRVHFADGMELEIAMLKRDQMSVMSVLGYLME